MELFPLSDESLDQQLCDVPLPAGLVERLQQSIEWTDPELDHRIADVPLPAGLIVRLSRIAPPQHQRRRLAQWAVAATLFLGVGLSYACAWVVYVTSGYRIAQTSGPQWLDTFLPSGGMQLTAESIDSLPGPDLAEYVVDEPVFPGDQTPEIELATVETAPPIPRFPTPFAALERDRATARTVEMSLEHFGAGVLGSSQVMEDLPEWQLVPGLVPRGAEPPKSPGFDLAFLHATRFHPVVMPMVDKDLATSRLPLSSSRESYLLARRMLDGGELPPAEMIRTEEFLAVMDYGFPAPSRDRVSLHTAAGPSPLGGAQLRLLQVGVRAAEVDTMHRRAAHLIVAIDVSSSMQRGARLEQIQNALRQVLSRLLPQDRVTLLAFGQDSQVLIEEAGPEHAAQLVSAIDSLAVKPGSNPVKALRLAYGLAAEAAARSEHTQQVMLLTDSLVEVDRLATMPLEEYLQASVGRYARLWLVDVSHNSFVPEHWTHVAQAAGGRVHVAATSDQMRWLMLEALSGQSQQIAGEVSISTWFNPQSVAGYRLFGHEATLLPAEPQSELYSGQTGVGLYELQLLPKGADHVATVTLTWKDASTGQRHTLSQRIVRANFAKNLASEPISLQLATLAAEAAEVLRRSPYRDSSSFRGVRELAGEASGPAVENQSYQELMSLVRQAERARPASPRLRQLWNRGGVR